MSDSELLTMIATLRRVAGPGIVREIAAEASKDVGAALERTAKAGTTPDGEAWAPRKEDGGRAMANAAEHVTTKPVGGRVQVTLSGPDAWHQQGVRGEPKRVVIPTGSRVPDVVAEAAAKGAGRVFDRLMRAI